MNATSKRSPARDRTLGIFVFTLTLSLLGSACQSLPETPKVDFVEPKAATAKVPARAIERASSGSLFSKVSYRPGFEDPRACAVGDVVTIAIVENVTASQVSNSTANRTSSGSASISPMPLFSAAAQAKLKAGIGVASANDFSGKGGTASANTFTGSITTTVMDVLPNGHLVVTGEKQIGVNQNVDVLRFSGTVDPSLLQPGNIVNSTQVANARIESKGRGAQEEAQTVGWLTRLFFNVSPF
jgi:flagellar L-ring protein precursor FlgH